jgi:CheY-like chemotaxis protein/anti-sigma regulatory factor (Ser/Thr protein kinase)
LSTVVSDVIEQLRPLASAKQLRLGFEQAQADLQVWADPDRLSQILTNLIDNAIKYTPEGGQVDVEVWADARDLAHVLVRDTGQGIPEDALPKLFDPFFRVHHQERNQIKGLGLGLAIVKDLVDLHGGTIAVRSEIDRGTEFEFTLPLRRPQEAQPSVPLPVYRRLLVIDDDRDIGVLLKDRLQAEGYEVHLAENGRTAIRLVAAGTVDGVLLDIALPGSDGMDLLREIRNTERGLPVVIMTAVEGLDRAMAAIEAGAQGYLLKPFDAAQLRQIVDRWFKHQHGSSADFPVSSTG